MPALQCGTVLRPNVWMRGAKMDFLERLFGYSPDAGDGTIEVLIIVALLLVAASIWFSSRRVPQKTKIQPPN